MPEQVKLLQNLLDYCSVKNKVISKNIANISTQGYKREDVVFKDILDENVKSMLKTSEQKHMKFINAGDPESQYQIVTDKSQEMDSGYNNVNIDEEMTELAENTLKFKFASKKMNEYFRVMQSVIKGGGGM